MSLSFDVSEECKITVKKYTKEMSDFFDGGVEDWIEAKRIDNISTRIINKIAYCKENNPRVSGMSFVFEYKNVKMIIYLRFMGQVGKISVDNHLTAKAIEQLVGTMCN